MYQKERMSPFRRELEPLPGVKVTQAVQFLGSGNLTTGSGDQLLLDKSTKAWRRWVYYKNKKKIPDLCTNIYLNKLMIEKIERACLAIAGRHHFVAEEYFKQAMDETVLQFNNPRSDSSEALDRLGAICLHNKEIPKAITCFEYSLHMRRLMYGKEAVHEKILQSLVYLGNAWAEYDNLHRAIIVFEKALHVATELSANKKTNNCHVREAEILHNLGTCWERLHEHHSAIECYEKAEKLRRLTAMPDVCIRAQSIKKKSVET